MLSERDEMRLDRIVDLSPYSAKESMRQYISEKNEQIAILRDRIDELGGYHDDI